MEGWLDRIRKKDKDGGMEGWRDGWMDRKQRIEWIGEGEGEGEKGRRRRIGWKEGLDGLVRVTGFQCIV